MIEKVKNQISKLKTNNNFSTIYVLGNLLVNEDSLPLKILPHLKDKFPGVHFQIIDPMEDFLPDMGEPLVIIDAVKGIKKVTVFTNLENFKKFKKVSPHDYDLITHLLLLRKLHRLPEKIFIIGLPFLYRHLTSKKCAAQERQGS